MEIKKYRQEYYNKNKNKIKSNSKNNYNINKKVILKRHKDRYYSNNSLCSIILQRAKRRAKLKNIPFNLTIKDIIIPEKCPLLEIKLERNFGGKPKENSPSLDKINPHLGYIIGNVRVISHKANMMKSNATEKELILFCKNFLNDSKRTKI